MIYKDLSETEKKISELEHLDVLDANTDQVEAKLDTLNTNTDQVEGLLGDILSTMSSKLDTIANKLDIIEGDLVTINGTCSDTTHEVTTQGQAIVRAIEGQ